MSSVGVATVTFCSDVPLYWQVLEYYKKITEDSEYGHNCTPREIDCCCSNPLDHEKCESHGSNILPLDSVVEYTSAARLS